MATSLAPQRQTPHPPPPLTMTTPPPMDVSALVGESSGVSYPTPSSTSAARPSLSLPPTTAPPPEPTPISSMDRGRIYRYKTPQTPNLKINTERLTVLMLYNSQLEPVCVDLGIRCVRIHGRQIPDIRPRPCTKGHNLLSHWDSQDRRPITPPPCIRLVVKDANTQEELEIKSVFSKSSLHNTISPW